MAENKSSVREALAELDHSQWAHCAEYMLDTIAKGFETAKHRLPGAAKLFRDLPEVVRWRRQIATPYSELTEVEKDSDREWADKTKAVIMTFDEVVSALELLEIKLAPEPKEAEPKEDEPKEDEPKEDEPKEDEPAI